jgi:ABC-type multidrug transport system fused ATPase/permease subunit
VGIIGPSGSGKTTLALLLAGLHPVALPGGITGGSASLFFAFATPN